MGDATNLTATHAHHDSSPTAQVWYSAVNLLLHKYPTMLTAAAEQIQSRLNHIKLNVSRIQNI